MPIFMIGTQRSGSNFLRLMLDQSSCLTAPHPPHIVERMIDIAPRYGDVASNGRFGELVEDVCSLVDANPVPWSDAPLDRDDIAARCHDQSFLSVMDAVYDWKRADAGSEDWICKSLANVHYLEELETHFGERCLYIYLYRDGRDVALSFQKAVVGEKHIYAIAKQWDMEQQKALAFWEQKLDKVFPLAYESLISQTRETLGALCGFLGVPWDEAMLESHRSAEAARTASAGTLWNNVTNPVMRDNYEKFRREMRVEDMRLFERVAGRSLDVLGYQRAILPPACDEVTEDEAAGYQAENDRMKVAFNKEMGDTEETRKRNVQKRVLDGIRFRLDVA